MLTEHAAQRVLARMNLPAEHAAEIVVGLWEAARPATAIDFSLFGARQLVGRKYRVTTDGEWMIVRSVNSNQFITILHR